MGEPVPGRREVWVSLALTVGAYFWGTAVVVAALIVRERLGPGVSLPIRLGLAAVMAPLGLASGWPGLRMALKARGIRVPAAKLEGLDAQHGGASAAVAFLNAGMAPLRVPLILIAWNVCISLAVGALALLISLSAQT